MIVNKPIEKLKPAGKSQTSFDSSTKFDSSASPNLFVENKSAPAKIIDSDSDSDSSQYQDCTFRGSMRKPNGETYEASSILHQKHSKAFTCLDTIFMEQASGRHNENCSFVGHLSAKRCCKTGKV